MEIENEFYEGLHTHYRRSEIRQLFQQFRESYAQLLPAGEAFKAGMREGLRQLQKGVPHQYILGKAYFGDLVLTVNSSVLIPRPETEELAELIRQDFQAAIGLSVLDVGTGSGCLAIFLARHLPQSQVAALDISEAALAVARKNGLVHQVAVDFFQKDVLRESLSPAAEFDLIVSNPPYIDRSEEESMATQVKDFEPREALFPTGDDPLVFYRRLRDMADEHLKDGGRLYLEINAAFAAETLSILEGGRWRSELLKDLSGNYRFIRSTRI